MWEAAAGAAIGGIMSNIGQSSANRANERIAKENRSFQARMSNTAYQRSAADLEQAGLNRILSLGSPASSPAGATATMKNTKEQAAAITAQLGLNLAQIQKTKAETDLINQQYDLKAPAQTVATKGLKVATELPQQIGKWIGGNLPQPTRIMEMGASDAKTLTRAWDSTREHVRSKVTRDAKTIKGGWDHMKGIFKKIANDLSLSDHEKLQLKRYQNRIK